MSSMKLILVLAFVMFFVGWCLIAYLSIQKGLLFGIFDYYLSVVKNGFGWIINKFRRG